MIAIVVHAYIKLWLTLSNILLLVDCAFAQVNDPFRCAVQVMQYLVFLSCCDALKFGTFNYILAPGTSTTFPGDLYMAVVTVIIGTVFGPYQYV